MMPSGTFRRRRTWNPAAALDRPRAGIDGKVMNSHTKVRPPAGRRLKKAPRQPIYWPRKLPSGAATVVASALPPFRSPRAGHLVFGHQPHDDRSRHRPEAADNDAKERSADDHEDA